ncbi:hypothetical protein [Pelagicoccus albus]|uniref:Uncharacterized protein n=1 Tax=Pelagicoccus albus TaxID=415222 RepID=A0A7X1B6E5_9BACT|nr:hypothetical protein [Pelagicoccus albus]MBC2606533.1 hypothetical protein [Pelagicoccus albus]
MKAFIRLTLGIGLCLALLSESEISAQDATELDEAMSGAAEAALARVAQDAEKRGVDKRSPASTSQVRRKARVGTSDPIYRHGIPYYDEWTIRAGALKLRVPAYPGWEAVKAGTEFYYSQASNGKPGEHLALPIMNSDFVRGTRSKYVNNFGLVWVPQEHAFTSMTPERFAVVKDTLKSQLVEDRKMRVEREDFWEFEDYLAFKKGNDESVEESLNGYWFRANEEEDIITYFAISEFVFQTPREELRQPMIETMSYALVRGKLLRIDFKRLFLSDEDVSQLLNFTRTFIQDMRAVNGISERKIR